MKKILIIEDDQIVANIYRGKFASEGYDVQIAEDGCAGLESVQSFRPDAVILDLIMPNLSGLETLHRIRQLRKDTPVVLSSGFDQYSIADKCRGLKNVSFITKPYDKQKLIEELDRFC